MAPAKKTLEHRDLQRLPESEEFTFECSSLQLALRALALSCLYLSPFPLFNRVVPAQTRLSSKATDDHGLPSVSSGQIEI